MAKRTWHTAITAICSRVTRRPRVSALKMMGNRYRLSSGLELLPLNHSTAVMNMTMDQDSISNRVRVWPGKKRRARNRAIAAANATSNPSIGHNCFARSRDRMSTSAANARQRISMERVLRTAYGCRTAAVTPPRPLTVGTLSSCMARLTSGSRCSRGTLAAGGAAGGTAGSSARSSSMSGEMPR